MEHHTTTSRAEAERLLGVAEKLLGDREFGSSRDFAMLAQETEPLLEGPDQILAVIDVLQASDKRINNSHPDWYSVLQLPARSDDTDAIKKQYRRLVLLLHPDKNKFPFADSAFRVLSDAWAILSDPLKKSGYDAQISVFAKVDLTAKKPAPRSAQHHHNPSPRQTVDLSQQKLPVRRSGRGSGSGSGARDSAGSRQGDSSNINRIAYFWTTCPYCYNLYQYPRTYEGCCLKCQNCSRAFTAAAILSMPPLVPGKEAYYCCWGFFPMGFVDGGKASGLPNWMPPMFPANANAAPVGSGGAPLAPNANATPVRAASVNVMAGRPPSGSGKKRGRPRKYA